MSNKVVPADSVPRTASTPSSGHISRKRAKSVLSGLSPALTLALFLGLWQFASKQGIFNEIIVPAPSDIFSALLELLTREYFWTAVQATLLATVIGFALGAIVGFVLGALVSEVPEFKRATYPWIVLFQNMPRIALAPLFLTWFGFGIASKVVLAVTIVFVPLVINTVVGLQSVTEDERVLLKSLGATRWQVFVRLSLPSAAPSIMAGLKLASTFSLLAVILGEFVGATEGMGVLLKDLNFRLDIAGAFAVALCLAFIGLAFFGLVALAEKRLIFWRSE